MMKVWEKIYNNGMIYEPWDLDTLEMPDNLLEIVEAIQSKLLMSIVANEQIARIRELERSVLNFEPMEHRPALRTAIKSAKTRIFALLLAELQRTDCPVELRTETGDRRYPGLYYSNEIVIPWDYGYLVLIEDRTLGNRLVWPSRGE